MSEHKEILERWQKFPINLGKSSFRLPWSEVGSNLFSDDQNNPRTGSADLWWCVKCRDAKQSKILWRLYMSQPYAESDQINQMLRSPRCQRCWPDAESAKIQTVKANETWERLHCCGDDGTMKALSPLCLHSLKRRCLKLNEDE